MSQPKTCRDCLWFARCQWLLGRIGDESECDFSPSRFTVNRELERISRIAELEEENKRLRAENAGMLASGGYAHLSGERDRLQREADTARNAAHLLAEQGNRLADQCRTLEAELEAIRVVFEPVKDWYDGGGETKEPPLHVMIGQAAKDLLDDRQVVLAVMRLVHAAERYYASASRDENRMPALTASGAKEIRRVIEEAKRG